MINPFTIRRVLREHSLTFSLVVALAMVGVSTWGTLYDALRRWLALGLLGLSPAYSLRR